MIHIMNNKPSWASNMLPVFFPSVLFCLQQPRPQTTSATHPYVEDVIDDAYMEDITDDSSPSLNLSRINSPSGFEACLLSVYLVHY